MYRKQIQDGARRHLEFQKVVFCARSYPRMDKIYRHTKFDVNIFIDDQNTDENIYQNGGRRHLEF